MDPENLPTPEQAAQAQADREACDAACAAWRAAHPDEVAADAATHARVRAEMLAASVDPPAGTA